MAVSGAIASQFFNFSVGWTLNLIKTIYYQGNIEFDIFALKNKDPKSYIYKTSVYA